VLRFDICAFASLREKSFFALTEILTQSRKDAKEEGNRYEDEDLNR
jgi:hypothetical protein